MTSEEHIKEILGRGGILIRDTVTYKIKEDIKSLFIESFKAVDKTFVKYEHLPEYDQVIDWLQDSKGKGLFLTGNVGRGKSVILRSIVPLFFRVFHNKVLHPMPARKLHTFEPNWAACIDDIGQDIVVNDYGTKIYAIDNVICDCEDNMKLLIMSSNLNKTQLIEKYGVRIEDRINRLCKVVIFKGESLRK